MLYSRRAPFLNAHRAGCDLGSAVGGQSLNAGCCIPAAWSCALAGCNSRIFRRIAERGTTNALLGAQQIKVDLLRLSNSGNQILLWNWYRIGNHYTANAYMAKWYEALEAITFGRQDSSRIILATAVTPEGNSQEILQDFLTAHLPGIEMSLDATVQKSKK